MEEENNQESQKLTSKPLVISAILAAIIIGGAIWFVSRPQSNEQSSFAQKTDNKTITMAELKAADGKNGRDCYVAVDGRVYQISDVPQWQNGEHTTSEGQASCGGDMSSVINQSPHGRRVLEQLDIVGKLES